MIYKAMWPRAVHHERPDNDRDDALRAQGHSLPHRVSNGAGTHGANDAGYPTRRLSMMPAQLVVFHETSPCQRKY
jgi:hypothetical protein